MEWRTLKLKYDIQQNSPKRLTKPKKKAKIDFGGIPKSLFIFLGGNKNGRS